MPDHVVPANLNRLPTEIRESEKNALIDAVHWAAGCQNATLAATIMTCPHSHQREISICLRNPELQFSAASGKCKTNKAVRLIFDNHTNWLSKSVVCITGLVTTGLP